jgi:hypothetical protein
MSAKVYLTSPYARGKAQRLIAEAPDGYVCEIREANRTDEQNKILHAAIDDIRFQVPGAEQWSKEEWKLRFLHALRNETRFLPELDGNGMFPVGQRTSELSKTQFSALLDIVFEWGGRNGVVWSDQARAA